jgi:16S rRNA processing protein RimM
MTANDSNYIAVGKVVGVYGHQGWLKILVYSGQPDRFEEVKVLYIQTETGMTGKRVSGTRYHGNGLLLKLNDIDDPESARGLKGSELFLPDSQQIELPVDHYFVHDLIGLKAFDVEKGYLGDIVDVWSGGASDILVIQSGQQEILVPAIAEFVKEVELKAGRITVRMWEEM